MRKSLLIPVALAALLAGCSLAPQYLRPEAPVAASYPEAADGYPAVPPSKETRPAPDIGWRTFFPDARLQALIAAALEHNRDLRTAALNIEQARALYGIQRADRLPTVDAAASAVRARTPAALSPSGAAVTSSEYEVGLSLSAFELDFFGRVKSLTDAALSRYLATEEARRAAHISLVAEVARAYLAERAFAEQLELARQTLAGRENAYDLAKQRFEAGAASALDLKQAETLVESARVSAAALARQRAQAANALTLLVGRPIADLPAPTALAAQHIVTDIPAGLPSDLLTRRPDIRAAEQALIAAHADIGAARAAFFPRITLTAFVGSASDQLSGLFDAGTGAWSFVPHLVLPIFDGGRNRANLALSEVRKDLEVAAYEKTIQSAFREVADALVARGALDEQVAAQDRLRAAQAERLALADQRYRGGVASYLDVLDAQRELFDAEQALVQARQLRLTNAIGLYRALGGGWNERDVARM